MIRFAFLLLLVSMLPSCGSCGDKCAEHDKRTPTEIKPETTGTIVGRIIYKGDAKSSKVNIAASGCGRTGEVDAEDLILKDGRVQNAFVYVQLPESFVFRAPSDAVHLDQRGCLFIPRIVAAQVCQPIQVSSSDSETHNVNSYPFFNVTVNQGAPRLVKFHEAGMHQVTCDIHPWMTGYVCVVDHPFFKLTGADGMFEIKGVPEGQYGVSVWHERLEAKAIEVKVVRGETAAPIEFEMTPKR